MKRVGGSQWRRTDGYFYFLFCELAPDFTAGVSWLFVVGWFHNLHHRDLQSSVFLGRCADYTRNSSS